MQLIDARDDYGIHFDQSRFVQWIKETKLCGWVDFGEKEKNTFTLDQNCISNHFSILEFNKLVGIEIANPRDFHLDLAEI